jgi:O-antigen/teichoic acid export membrane protein
MVAEKLVKMFIQLATMMIFARTLGAEDLGSILYCFAIASSFLFLNNLGLDTIFVKKIIESENEKEIYLFNTLFSRMVVSLLCIAMINLAGIFLVDGNTRELLFVISLYHLILPFSTFDWYYQAKGRGDISSISHVFGYVFGLISRIIVVFYYPSLVILGLIYSIELIVSLFVYFFIKREFVLSKYFKINVGYIKDMIKESYPLIVSSGLVILYMRVDQVMIGKMLNHESVSYYVAATRLSEAWYFLGVTLVTAYFPLALKIKNDKGDSEYLDIIMKLSKYLILLSYIVVAITSFYSDLIINLLYGDEFSESSGVLFVMGFVIPFVYLGTIATKMYIIEGHRSVILYRSIVGLFVNVILNYISTLVSQILASYVFNGLSKDRTVFTLQTKLLFFIK